MDFDPEDTPQGKLPPWEIAKAIAYEQVLNKMEEHLEKTCWQLTGKGKKDFTAEQLTLVGGGKPTGRAVQLLWTKVKEDGDWYPGKKTDQRSGRPPSISDAQKQAIADKAMELKKDLLAPTPERVRILMPRKTINKKSGAPISDFTIRTIFKTLCYDETEDDPWHYLNSPQQDCLTESMKPHRVKTADHVLKNVGEGAAWNFVAFDPCFSLLPTNQVKPNKEKRRQSNTTKQTKKTQQYKKPGEVRLAENSCDGQ